MKAKKSKKEESSQYFIEKKELLELEMKMAELKHKMKMEDFAYCRESDRLHHERELERGRIKSAEIRKSQLRKHGY